jgi:hypothetical protein
MRRGKDKNNITISHQVEVIDEYPDEEANTTTQRRVPPGIKVKPNKTSQKTH